MSGGAEVVLTGNEKVLSKGPGGRTTLVSSPLLALPTLSVPASLPLSLSPERSRSLAVSPHVYSCTPFLPTPSLIGHKVLSLCNTHTHTHTHTHTYFYKH